MKNKQIRSVLIAFVFVAVFAVTFALVFMGGNKEENPPKDNETTTQDSGSKKEPVVEKPLYDYDLSEYITLGEFPNVSYSVDDIEKYVNQSVKNIALQNAEFKEVSRTTVQDGDTVVADFVGTMDGKEFNGGSAKGQYITIGSGAYIEGFESGLIGHSVGETVVLNLKFPDPYPNSADLAGKDVTFTITINKLGVRELPEVTDDMVKSMGSGLFSTVAEYKEYMRKYYTEYVVWNAYYATCEIVKYPEDDVNAFMDEMIDYYESMASYYQISLEDLVKTSGIESLEVFKSQLLSEIKKNMAQEMAVYHTIRTHNIELTDEEFNSIALEFAKDEGYNTVDALKNVIGETSLEVEVYRLKVISLILEAAQN